MIDLQGDLGRLAVSLVLGTAVGIERELSEKPAGLKTNVLICLGSTLFTILSARAAGSGWDPGRVAAQIVSGIGFLGAGAILRDGEHVIGLTTAATIWVVASIGMGAGLGRHALAAAGTLAVLAVQLGLHRLDILVDGLRQRRVFRVVSDPDDGCVEALARIFRAHEIRVLSRKVMKRNNLYHSEWFTTGSPRGQESAVREMLQSSHVIEVTY